jgi:hypothetical protein
MPKGTVLAGNTDLLGYWGGGGVGGIHTLDVKLFYAVEVLAAVYPHSIHAEVAGEDALLQREVVVESRPLQTLDPRFTTFRFLVYALEWSYILVQKMPQVRPPPQHKKNSHYSSPATLSSYC